ncbi:MAG: DUF2946 family protein [Burkholderiaceae bacterium]|nr:DUF2946 family protein [Burkholderiaceae bacterium]
MLFAALAPSLSHLLAASQGRTWAEICATGGIVRKAVLPDPGDEAPPVAIAGADCPYCLVQGDSPVLPSSRPVAAFRISIALGVFGGPAQVRIEPSPPRAPT